MRSERLLGFDLARILAILYIVGVYHNLGYVGFWDNNPCILSMVYTTLGVFTFLSAFLLSSKYSFNNTNETLQFLKKRVIRVWPLFVISSLLLWAIHFNPLWPTIKGIFGLSPFWKPASITMWYVAMLIGLYLVTPFVVKGSVTVQILKVCFVMTVVGMIQLIFQSVVPKTFNYYLVYLIGLLLGNNKYESTIRFLKSKKTLWISVLWMVMILLVFITKSDWLKSFSGVLGIVAILNICLLFSERLNANHKFVKVVSILSYASFGTYLFHREIMWAMFQIYKPFEGRFVFLEVLLIGVPITIICAYFIQKAYDVTLNNLNIGC